MFEVEKSLKPPLVQSLQALSTIHLFHTVLRVIFLKCRRDQRLTLPNVKTKLFYLV